MVVADTQHMKFCELMLPFGNWFCIVSPQLFQVVVYQMAMIAMTALGIYPTDQLSLVKVCYVPLSLCIHCGAPFLAGLQVNQP